MNIFRMFDHVYTRNIRVFSDGKEIDITHYNKSFDDLFDCCFTEYLAGGFPDWHGYGGYTFSNGAVLKYTQHLVTMDFDDRTVLHENDVVICILTDFIADCSIEELTTDDGVEGPRLDSLSFEFANTWEYETESYICFPRYFDKLADSFSRTKYQQVVENRIARILYNNYLSSSYRSCGSRNN